MAYEREVFENNTFVDAARVLNKFDAALFAMSKSGESVWTNELPEEDFAAQDVVVTASAEPKFYEIEFSPYTTSPEFRLTSGKIPIEYGTRLQAAYSTSVRFRDVTVTLDGVTLTFTFDTGRSTSSSSTTSAKNVVPQRIRLYY